MKWIKKLFYCVAQEGHPPMLFPGYHTDVDPSTLKMKSSDVWLEKNQWDANKISFLSSNLSTCLIQ